ncbi:hypothetical protein JIN84_01150 [Luteolibacter yonseiensis]|uniref:Uncharacterized protein n=1 Tax=Luteolibacter yonseiensis TaxID=1144680 RepID=A0A934QZZ8_9BACT|nr:hypothetical protein [Luteolibacter yonseiensis]MBK1814214.1 hypothetical protein [Luteolibacter yonseiensis]
MRRGFTLVATLMMMVLLMTVLIGMISLSGISLRSSPSSRREAEANARLAMMDAIGRLQVLAGPDTRITAPSDLIDPASGPTVGVWRSWEGTDHGADGLPVIPGYGRKRQNGNAGEPDGAGRFLGWLVSGAESRDDVNVPPDVAAGEGRVALLAGGSLGAAVHGKEIHMKPVLIESGKTRGGYAWWVGGENQKAKVDHEDVSDLAPADWVDRMKSRTDASPGSFGLRDEALLDRVETRRSYELLVAETGTGGAAGTYHDLSPWARGLMTNSATGGWRKDLSLMSENWDSLPSRGLPFFGLKPGESTKAAKADENHPPGMLLYPWAAPLEGPSTTSKWNMNGAVVSWNALRDFMMQYRQIASASAGGEIHFPPSISNQLGNSTQAHRRDTVRRFPTVARVQWVYSYGAGKLQDGRYQAELIVNPVVTLWNPYNVGITIDRFEIEVEEAAPVSFSFSVGREVADNVPLSRLAFSSGKQISLKLVLKDPGGAHTFKPGETRVFSPTSAKPQDFTARELELTPGYRTYGGYRFKNLRDGAKPLIAGGGDLFSASMTFNADVRYGKKRIGIFMDIHGSPAFGGDTQKLATHRMEIREDIARNEKFYPPIPREETPSVSLETAAASNQVFGSSMFGFRMASDVSIATRGLLQTNPLVFNTELGDKALAALGVAAAGVDHPANSPYDFRFQAHAGWSDSGLPQADPSTGRGFIVSGQDASNGLGRCVLVELPVRPVLSLAELTHFDFRNNNAVPPFSLNLIGNSDANPLLPSDGVRLNALQHDDSYIANHLLFDDWFVSGITSRPDGWKGSGGTPKGRLFADAVEKSMALPNRCYIAGPGLSGLSRDALEAMVDGSGAYLDIAGKLEVDGMFNVNSTSVKAWKALLSGMTRTQVPTLVESGGGWAVKPSKAVDHAVSRFSIAADGRPGEQGGSGLFPEANDFTGHRALSEEQIDGLAREIVGQVRKRGPYLSLSEFVNRSLGGDEELSLTGTVQAGLDKLAKATGALNPYETLQKNSRRITSSDLPSSTAAYRFPKAAEGHAAYGVPGWIRQADILRPIAPVLSVRDDTFVIRCYGDSRSPEGDIRSRAWCEVVVRRCAPFVGDGAAPSEADDPESKRRFGRKFEIVSFRWLNPGEV